MQDISAASPMPLLEKWDKRDSKFRPQFAIFLKLSCSAFDLLTQFVALFDTKVQRQMRASSSACIKLTAPGALNLSQVGSMGWLLVGGMRVLEASVCILHNIWVGCLLNNTWVGSFSSSQYLGRMFNAQYLGKTMCNVVSPAQQNLCSVRSEAP